MMHCKKYSKEGDDGNILKIIYNLLHNRFGKMKNWWPAESDFEVMIGAILGQNTAWINVEKAIYNLKSRNLLSFEAMETIDLDLLKEFIRPSGYYNQKALKIKEFINFVKKEYNFSIELMKNENVSVMREKLLDISGIGEETADSIMLYALKKPVFVIDAYTRRILERHYIIESALKEKYKNLQKYFTDNINNIFYVYDEETVEEENSGTNDKTNVEIYNEYHALIVMTGKMFCKRIPLCNDCPLNKLNNLT